MKDLGVFGSKGGFFFSILLKISKKDIRRSISLIFTVINLKMIPRQLLRLLNLPGTQVFYIHEVAKIVMICKNKNFIFTTFEVIWLGLEGFRNNHQLIVISLISRLYQDYFLGEECHWIPPA